MSENQEKPQWFTIRDAAVYLKVGEPTIYRWMREGKMTYRKVGDSTRFLQEDLDSMVRVFHSSRDTYKVEAYCPLCGHDELVDGQLQSTGLVYFRPRKTKFYTFRTANVKTRAYMCTRCGGIAWFGYAEKLNKLRLEPESEPE